MSKPTCEKCGSEKDLIGIDKFLYAHGIRYYREYESPTYCDACLREEINRFRDTPVTMEKHDENKTKTTREFGKKL